MIIKAVRIQYLHIEIFINRYLQNANIVAIVTIFIVYINTKQFIFEIE